MIPVLLFHADVSGFDGGFLGVDVFFVISGFLITSILLSQAELGRLSITGFYNRRIRRIFPALFVLLAITTLIAAVLFTPSAFERYGRSLVATTLFSSNILFFLESGYFDAASHEKPLLHTWSLAVEEQFYLVWPLLIWAFIHFGAKRYLHLFLFAGVAASFALAAVLPLWSIEATFYLPFTRAWELGLGALLAIKPPKAPVGRLRDLVCAAGLLAIVFAIVTFNDSTPLAAASGLACLGTAILIAYNNEKTIAARLLSLRLCVGIGLISYSLYLWHWPLLAFAHYYYSAPPALGLRLALLALATSLAWASYIFVEKPLRRPGPPRNAFIASIAVMAVLLAAGLAIIASRGFPQRFGPEVVRAEKSLVLERPCRGCTFATGTGPQILLWGDSHAMAIMPAVRDFARANNAEAIGFALQACPSIVGAQPLRGEDSDPAACRAFQEQAIARVSTLDRARLIILASRWTMPSETTRFGREEGERYFLTDEKTRAHSVAESRRALQEGLQRTVDTLAQLQPHATILLIGQPPEVGFNAGECIVRGMTWRRAIPACEAIPKSALERLQFGNHLLSRLASERPQVSALFLSRVLCRGTSCPTRVGETLIYRDDDHLSGDGSRLLLGGCLATFLDSRTDGPGRLPDRPGCSANALAR